MENNLSIAQSGIICDNPNCDWEDKSVTHEETQNWLNRPCPKCGENLLTQDDLDNYNLVMASVQLVNSLSEKEIIELIKASESIVPELMESPFLKDAVGKEILQNPDAQNVVMRVGTHKEVKATEIIIQN